MEQVSAAANYTLRFINQTNKSIFLTGKAGTGKTTLLKEIIATTHKNTVVVAPTGIAALNANGVTIHSMFQLPFAAFIPDNKQLPHFSGTVKFENRDSLGRHFKMNNVKRSVIRNMELLVIDEVSMLRADVLDAMDFMMRKVRRNERPFGGVQVLFIGDLLQLPPVVKNEEWEMLKNYYRGMFFFHSHVIQQFPPLYIELDKIFRQTDAEFIDVLNKKVLDEKVPILGICVGMQMLAHSSEEGILKGLSWIPGKVRKFDKNLIPDKPKIPHLGWNSIVTINECSLFKDIDPETGFYFMHSYYFECFDEASVIAKTNYGKTFHSAVNSENIYGVQFHPEKSHDNGIQLLKN